MITKLLVVAAIALAHVGGTATAHGEPTPINTGPSPFGALSCSCTETTPAGSLADEIDRGIRSGLAELGVRSLQGGTVDGDVELLVVERHQARDRGDGG
jgi:hypothetical protein